MRVPIAVRSEVDGSSLCRECGLCCDGALFSNTALDADEVDRAVAIGASVVTRSDADGSEYPALTQRCSLFRSGCCSVYDVWRPRTCERFVCALLHDFEQGARSLAESVRLVRLAQEARNEVDAARTAHENALDPEILLPAAAFEVLRKRYFERVTSDEPTIPALEPEVQ